MSLIVISSEFAEEGAPRVSGDEPVTTSNRRDIMPCSPRERG